MTAFQEGLKTKGDRAPYKVFDINIFLGFKFFVHPLGVCLSLRNSFSKPNSNLWSAGVVIILQRHVLNRWLAEKNKIVRIH